MDEKTRPWHHSVLTEYNAQMLSGLLYPHHVTTETPALYSFENEHHKPLESDLRGYFAVKDDGNNRSKYFISETAYKNLPVRVNSTDELLFSVSGRKDIVLYPTDVTPFSITPEKCFEHRTFFDTFAPFAHSEPEQWTLMKICAVMSLVGKTFLGICSLSEFGKTSIYQILHMLTKKAPVFQPRSLPGILVQINSDGVLVFDEAQGAASDVLKHMENFALQVAGNEPIYVNGAIRSKYTRTNYDVARQSLTFLYNLYSYYDTPEKEFWNNIWANQKAMESRFLCLKFDGTLLENFDKDFSTSKVASDNKMYYIHISKHLEHLKELKKSNKYTRRYTESNLLNLKGRHKLIYDELTWGIDLYAESQAEYDKLVRMLDDRVVAYAHMLGREMLRKGEEPKVVTEKVIDKLAVQDVPDALYDAEAAKNKVRSILNKKGEVEEMILLMDSGIKKDDLSEMFKSAEIFYSRPGMVRLI